MKTSISFYLIVFFVIGSIPCLALNTTISGRIKNKAVTEVRIGLYTNPIKVVPVNYKVKVKGGGLFTFNFDLDDATYGFIEFGDTIYNIFVLPGKTITLVVNRNLIAFNGPLQYENNFLYLLTKNEQWNYDNYKFTLSPDSNYVLMKLKQKKKFNLFFKSNKHHSFSVGFITFFKAEDACLFNKFLIHFPLEYCDTNHIFRDNSLFSKHYINKIGLYTNDSFIKAASYINIIREYIANETHTLVRVNNLSGQQARNILLTDSLTGKTRDYAIANEIYIDLQFKNKPDSMLMASFTRIAKDTKAINTVNNITNDYKFRNSFKGKILSEKLRNTLLVDTNGTEIKLGDLITGYRDKVLYIDVWGFYCPPCREEMPFTKNLKKEYKNLPIEFINITPDPEREFKSGWAKYFAVSGTKNNQYRFKKGFDAEILKEFNIIGIPQYLIIDSQGHLVEYNAPRPSNREELKPVLDEIIGVN